MSEGLPDGYRYINGYEIGKLADAMFRHSEFLPVYRNGNQVSYGENSIKMWGISTDQICHIFYDENEAFTKWEEIKASYHPLVGCCISSKLRLSSHTHGVRMIIKVDAEYVYCINDHTNDPGNMPGGDKIPLVDIHKYNVSSRKPDGYRYIQHLRVCW